MLMEQYNKKPFLLLLLFLVSFASRAQQAIYNRIQNEDFSNITATDVFDYQPLSSGPVLSDVVSDYNLAKANNSLQDILAAKPELVRLRVQISPGTAPMILKLKKAHFFASDFICKGSADNTPQGVTDALGLHYQGVVEGDEQNSLTAISFFRNNVTGMISNKQDGNYTIGKLEGQDLFIIYRDAKLTEKVREAYRDVGACHAKTDEQPETRDGGEGAKSSFEGKCLAVYMEINHDLHFIIGNDLALSLQYAAGSFNQVSVLYANESINIKLREVKVWQVTAPSPYTGTNSAQQLDIFQDSVSSTYVGNIAILLEESHYGGLAPVGGVCATNRRSSMCYAGVRSYYVNVPIYSWTIMVMTHEIGHVIGSRHTHDCVWNGNNTAIDTCGPYAGYPQVPGPCNAPMPPAQGGTIMSYCHQVAAVQISFANGFGQQPGDLLRTRVANAACLKACCPDLSLVLTSPINAAGDYFAEDFVHASNTVTVGSGAVRYRAGSHVRLDPGFSATSSGVGVFVAYIEPCWDVITGRMGPGEGNGGTEPLPADGPLKLFPNPVTNMLTLEYKTGCEKTVFTITDMRGAVLYRFDAQHSSTRETTHRQVVDVSRLLPGTYLLQAQCSSFREVRKFTVVP